DAPPPKADQADRSPYPAPLPHPPADEQADPQAPQRCPDQTGPADSRAATPAARPAPPSSSEDNVSHRAHWRGRAEHRRQRATGCYPRQGSSQTQPTYRTARPIQPAAGSRQARDAGAPSSWTGDPALLREAQAAASSAPA